MSERFVFGVDLDGVVADFYGGLRHIAADWLGVPLESLPEKVSYGLPEWGLNKDTYLELHKFAVTQRNLFRELRPVAGAPNVLRRLSRQDVHIRIITHRLFIKYFHQQAVQQTIAWLDHHDVPYWDLCFMAEKDAVGADLYIDDAPKNVAALRARHLPTIVFTNSTNAGVDGPRADSWAEVENLVLLELGKFRSKGHGSAA
jgi:5'(3')-deoxyribonucleotidase